MLQVRSIKPNLMVHAKLAERPADLFGERGLNVGTVDHLEGDRFIKLKRDGSADGEHHWIPLEWVEDVDDKAVYLNKTPEEVARGLINENPLRPHHNDRDERH